MVIEENLDILVVESNRYMVKQHQANKTPVPARISKDEMMKALGIVMYMSCVKVPRIRNYFHGTTQQVKRKIVRQN